MGLSQFESAMADNLSQLYGEFAVTVTITPKTGAPFTCPARIIRSPLEPTGQQGAKRVEFKVEVMIQQSDYPTPNIKGDQISFPLRPQDTTTTTRYITSLVSSHGAQWHFIVD